MGDGRCAKAEEGNSELAEPQEPQEPVDERVVGTHVRFGITEPISLGLPTQAENALTLQVQEELRRDAPLETQEGMRFRAAVLLELRRIVLQWIYEVSIQQGMDEESARKAGAKIFTFGSYRLGLVSPGSDIDALCVAPRHITRDAFFQVLAVKLKEHPDIADLSPVPDAYTPIIKMKLSGVEIDLLFARLSLLQVPDDLESLNDDNLLKNMDDKTVRSLNGCRVADHILDLVPDHDRYRDALRLVKIWAKRRGIYSNVLGFYGGITWAILVARVCQLYPYYNAAALVKRFFRVYDRWNWKNPVVLCPIREQPNVPGLMAFKVWNPKIYPHDRMHLMPICTPAFPSMNSTHNVTETTKRIILEEFGRAYKVVEQVEKGKCEWSEVYRRLPFFASFRHYLHIEVLAKSTQVFTKWTGWIESKLRHLVKHLEQIPSVQVRPWPDHVAFQDPEWPHATAIFMGLNIAKKSLHGQHGQTVNLRQQVTQFVEIINSWPDRAEYAGMFEMNVQARVRKDLPDYVPQDGNTSRRTKASVALAEATAADAAVAAEVAAERTILPAPQKTPAAITAAAPEESLLGETPAKRARVEAAPEAVAPIPAVPSVGSVLTGTNGAVVVSVPAQVANAVAVPAPAAPTQSASVAPNRALPLPGTISPLPSEPFAAALQQSSAARVPPAPGLVPGTGRPLMGFPKQLSTSGISAAAQEPSSIVGFFKVADAPLAAVTALATAAPPAPVRKTIGKIKVKLAG